MVFVELTEFLYKNGYEWSANDKDLIHFTMDIASGKLNELKLISTGIKHSAQKSSSDFIN